MKGFLVYEDSSTSTVILRCPRGLLHVYEGSFKSRERAGGLKKFFVGYDGVLHVRGSLWTSPILAVLYLVVCLESLEENIE